ncbi:hypothetical protein L1887_38158 [Cichorium endivia]|nr:hypothetical protein L1887_38158 [Cichorium endivia]
MVITKLMTIFPIVLLFIFHTSTAQTRIKAGYWYTGSEFPSFRRVVGDKTYVSTFATAVKKSNPSVIPLLSIWTPNGEYGNSANSSEFLTMTEDPSYRKNFIESSIKTARRYGFEGLDLYVTTLLSTTENMNTSNLGVLFDEWRVAVDSEMKKSTNQEKLILTMAGLYSPELNSVSYPVESVSRSFDWVHVRSYDYHTPLTENFTAAHGALYDPSSHVNTDYGINEWIKRGLPASKLVVGLAYHGYAWTLVDPTNSAIGAPAKGVAITRDGSVSYEYIKKYLRTYGVKPVYNSTYVMNYVKLVLCGLGLMTWKLLELKLSMRKQKGFLVTMHHKCRMITTGNSRKLLVSIDSGKYR